MIPNISCIFKKKGEHMKITATKEITLSLSPAKIARDYVKQLKEARKKFGQDMTLSELYDDYNCTLNSDMQGYIETIIHRELPEGFTYDYDYCIKLTEMVEEEVLELIEKED